MEAERWLGERAHAGSAVASAAAYDAGPH
jgi:hypothetical protein